MIHDLFSILLPQTCLGLFIIFQLILSMTLPVQYYKWSRLISVIGITASILLLSTVQIEPQYFGFKNSIMSDSYTQLFHFIIMFCGFFVVLLSDNLIKTVKHNAYSFQALLLTAILGAMTVVSANDILTLFISLEILSFSTYFLIATPNGYLSKEASFKYLITSAVSSGVFLFGASYLYGQTLTLNLNEIYEIIVSKQHSPLFAFSGIMISLGLISKLAVFPFANWILDVYKGCEISVLAFLTTIPKLALFGILCRLIIFPLGGTLELTICLILLSLITAFWANVYAIKEKNIKVILACSSAANAAYVLIAASIVSVYNLSAVLFYLICYVILNIAVFAFLNILESHNIKMYIDELKGFGKSNVGISLAYTIAVIGLAGIPITSGFVAKIYLFSAIAHAGLIFIPFLIILLVLTVVALYYYLKLIFPLFQISENSKLLKPTFSQKVVLLITIAITILIGIYPERLIELCKYIAYNI